MLLWDGRPARPERTGGTPIPQICVNYLILIPKFALITTVNCQLSTVNCQLSTDYLFP
ncbi:MAG: hypothetical protein JGK32_29780 [Microcoleus sp. PH2017_31_RDM_U_A]|uniref:hypothetical protein n=1 Tax=Microcoleus sp. PH2017_32_RDM_D_A TaxID=2798842 RepID=UPI001D435B13|nr:hypothetical protein [Microcoleus sp. PH2017_32_RDM_D_A]MCC3569416.1 hypothetical protein [Microcoleus sp. PH2017_31_RDM_U_A]